MPVAQFRHPDAQSQDVNDPLVGGILLAAALRGVLETISTYSIETDDDEDAWRKKWLRYCREELGLSDDPGSLAAEHREDWINEGVRTFCKSAKFMAKIRKQCIEGAS